MKRTVAALVLALGACTARQTWPAGTLTIGQQQEFLSLNPTLDNGQLSSELGELLFSYLLKYDSHGRLVGDVATEVPSLANGGISRDGLTITYHLRKGVRFADGAPLTARDCAWSIDAVNNPANNVQTRYGYDRVARAEAPNPQTLVLHLKAPFAPVLSLVLAPQGFPILPEHLLARYPNFNQVDFDSKPVGSGPYVVVDWVRGDRLEMRSNPDYFGGAPQIKRIVIRFIPDPTEGTNQLRTGEIQGYFNEQDYAQYPYLLSVPHVRVLDAPVSAIGAMIFNTRSPVTSDPRVRHALAEAIDFRSLVAKAYRGALAYHDAARGLFLWAFDPHAYPDIRYDPAAANRLLDAAGWPRGPDGVRARDGRPLELMLIIQAGVLGEEVAASNIAQYLHAVGARVAIRAYNVTQFGAPAAMGGPVYAGHFDLALYSFVNGDDPDPTDQFACSHVPPRGFNKSRMCDPRVDALLQAGRTTYDVAQRTAIYHRLEALLWQDLPIVALYQRRELDAFTDRLRGTSGSVDSVFWDAGRWRLGSASSSSGKGDVSRSLTTSSKTLD